MRVALYDAKRSLGRKFLVAGKGGLNLTHDAPVARMVPCYQGPGQLPGFWQEALAACDPEAVRAWAADLGVPTFAARTGRVYPQGMKAGQLLRAWIRRLHALGVATVPNHRLVALAGGNGSPWELQFDGQAPVTAAAVLLACGGGSWPQTGSDGRWIEALTNLGVAVAPLVAANCGWECAWPAPVLAAAEGQPLKNLLVRAGTRQATGELLVTRYGLEGGALYQLGPTLRAMPQPEISIDFKPAHSVDQLVAKMESVRRNVLAEARVRWHLGPAAAAILGAREVTDIRALAVLAKDFRITLTGPRPLAEAISSAGGVCWPELDAQLMIRRLPGVFVAGEMIDWEAPTGGYLLQGCFATGERAARGAAVWLRRI